MNSLTVTEILWSELGRYGIAKFSDGEKIYFQEDAAMTPNGFQDLTEDSLDEYVRAYFEHCHVPMRKMTPSHERIWHDAWTQE